MKFEWSIGLCQHVCGQTLKNCTNNVSFTEKLILNRFDDVFEEKRYETKLKEDISILTVKKLIRYLKTKK